MSTAHTMKTPLDPNQNLWELKDTKNKEEESDAEPFQYQEAVGYILYLSQISRPVLAFAASHLSQFNNCHTRAHVTAAKRVLRYLSRTKEAKLIFTNNNTGLIGYSDANHA